MKKIVLTNRKPGDVCALVDDEDYERIRKYAWWAVPRGNNLYAATRPWNKKEKRYESYYMHRLVLNAKRKECVDHINHVCLDNRKINLRMGTQQQNMCNQKKRKFSNNPYKGVQAVKRKHDFVFRSHITCNYKTKDLGQYNSSSFAALIYDKHARKMFGEFAYLNFNGYTLQDWFFDELKKRKKIMNDKCKYLDRVFKVDTAGQQL